MGNTPAIMSQDASKMVQGIAQEDKSCEDIIRLALQGKTT
jgi:Holliday junction DNA helicase RuvA